MGEIHYRVFVTGEHEPAYSTTSEAQAIEWAAKRSRVGDRLIIHREFRAAGQSVTDIRWDSEYDSSELSEPASRRCACAFCECPLPTDIDGIPCADCAAGVHVG